MNRRNFLKNTAASAPVVLSPINFIKPELEIKGQLNIIVLATNWGFKGTIDEFSKKIKDDGFDGMEIWWPGNKEKQKELFEALQKYQLQVGFLTSGDSAVYAEHERTFKNNVAAATDNIHQKPLYVNCHSGKDYYSFDQNAK
ncbi:MAG: sugar phosphate isomerase/epimerase, partial [Saprospiraceae bacterium]